ncbi:MAG TPA: bifunctional phosphopantothenoylcysteine decarboxylase/phosphopantothenate--cysteine ligase CoaBC, partial [Thermoplasmata archaeon]|nr:bifunctional phosphopantothenoylcysteine decarboxylase/phosphopantothenate--cysteine ligase CoaBC [Thermoplasmata archaeon]
GIRIVLGISGSIAAVEIPRIARELLRHGAEVQAVMSPEASRLVTEETITFATGHRPITQLTGDVEHVTLLGPGEGRADLLLIAPATANTISKIAHGIDDTPVTTFASVALGGGVPILVAPAMHAHMGQNPAVRASLATLRSWGVGVIEPQTAEGEEKIASPEEVAAAVLHRLAKGPWAGRKVVVIGGASRERIDDVRSVTNESTGATAVALAVQAHYRGAEVELWRGVLQVPVPSFLPERRWQSVGDLRELIRRERAGLRAASAVLVPAALSDFTLDARPGKISSRDNERLRLELVRAPKILTQLRSATPTASLLVGFKLEAGRSEEALGASAQQLLEENGLDFVAANDRASIGDARTSLLVLDRRGQRHWLSGPKVEVAGKLLDDLGRHLENRTVLAAVPRTAARRRLGGRRASAARPRGTFPGRSR